MAQNASWLGLRHLLQAPNKKSVDSLFVQVFETTVRPKLKRSMERLGGQHEEEGARKAAAAALAEAAMGALKLASLEEAREVLGSVAFVIERAMYECSATEDVAALFPAGFHAALRELLAVICAHHLPEWRAAAIDRMVGLPRLMSTQWRLDVKTAANAGRMNAPTVLVDLQVEAARTRVDDPVAARHVVFEMDRETLDTMLDGLTKIRAQLNAVAGVPQTQART